MVAPGVAIVAIPNVAAHVAAITIYVPPILAAVKTVVSKITAVFTPVAAIIADVLPDRKRRSKYRKAQ